MRNHFASLLEAAMDEDETIVLLYGDIGNKLFDSVRNKYPARTINCGVAEANMVSIAGGLASSGLKPVVYTISSFLYLKALEQIKLDICYPSRSVVLVGTGGGFSYAGLGTTHHSLEDFAVLGSIPNLRIFSPADRHECSLVFKSALGSGGPAWIRLGKKGEPCVHDAPPKVVGSAELLPLKIGKGDDNSAGREVLILATGLAVAEAERAARSLENIGVHAEVWSVPQLKPFPSARVAEIAGDLRFVVTVEEHVPIGGLHTAVRDSLDALSDVKVLALSTGDTFHSAVGSTGSARSNCYIDSEGIFSKVVSWINQT